MLRSEPVSPRPPMTSAKTTPEPKSTLAYSNGASSVELKKPEPKSTLAYSAGASKVDPKKPAASPAVSATDATMASPPMAVTGASGTDATIAADLRASTVATVPTTSRALTRTTVLPRVEIAGDAPAVTSDPRPRFEKIRPLGEGGMGEVALVLDNDIHREVAVKRLHREFVDAGSLIRFAEEVRTVGSLEHPNIAPVHDVGIDEEGQHYFVMKYVRGDTLEHVIERLAANDPKYVAKYTIDDRVEIFRGILRAVQYAHAQGIIHRDIKPANVMIGPYGEVVVMDWGLAKKIRAAKANIDQLAPPSDAPAAPEAGDERAKMFRTRHGALMGTPGYMSPEQSRGATDQIDERSDVYSLCVLFNELLTLRHYLHDLETVPAMLAAVAIHDHNKSIVTAESFQSGAPIELLYVAMHGMRHDPKDRFQSVDEILTRLQEIGEGQITVECPVTLMKRAGGESMRFIDRHPIAAMTLATVGVLGTLSGFVLGIIRLVHG
jgi:serine/threonine-protein kinase